MYCYSQNYYCSGLCVCECVEMKVGGLGLRERRKRMLKDVRA